MDTIDSASSSFSAASSHSSDDDIEEQLELSQEAVQDGGVVIDLDSHSSEEDALEPKARGKSTILYVLILTMHRGICPHHFLRNNSSNGMAWRLS